MVEVGALALVEVELGPEGDFDIDIMGYGPRKWVAALEDDGKMTG